MIHSKKYTDAIKSKHFRTLKLYLLEKRGAKCEHCKNDHEPLELHHKTYERLGKELPTDVELLCKKCHNKADEARANETRQRAADRAYYRRLAGYGRKVYGEDWEFVPDIEEEFDAWVEARGDYDDYE